MSRCHTGQNSFHHGTSLSSCTDHLTPLHPTTCNNPIGCHHATQTCHPSHSSLYELHIGATGLLSEVRGVLPDGHVTSSRHADWGSSGWIDLPCSLQSVCQRHAPTLAPGRVGPLCGRHCHHSDVPQTDAPCQLPGVIPQRPLTVVE